MGPTLLNTDRLSTFQERAARVSAQCARAQAQPARRQKVADVADNATYPLAILACFLIGIATVVLLRWLRFQVTGEIDPNAGLGILDALLIGGMTMAMREVMNFRQPAFTAANVLGLSVGLLTVHNLVHIVPSLFAWMFSEDWVDVIVYETAFPSLMFGATNVPIL